MTTHQMTTARHAGPLSAEMQACIAACSECHAVCLETAVRCLGMGGNHAEPRHIGMLLDCADICRTSADFMLRGSTMHYLTCGACATVCDVCADACARFQDDFMQACAALCRTCAASCREMAAHGGHVGH